MLSFLYLWVIKLNQNKDLFTCTNNAQHLDVDYLLEVAQTNGGTILTAIIIIDAFIFFVVPV